jgi:lysophospholipase L1-like esterase
MNMNLKHFRIVAILAFSLLCISATLDKINNVLIIGDSISIGYTPFLKSKLSPNVNVEHSPGNGGSTIRGKENVEKWIDGREWDVIVFNFGLHDMVHKDSLNKYDVNGKVSVSLDNYRYNLNEIVSILRQTTAKLIFVNTTEVPLNASGRKVEDPEKYNAVALEVMKENGIIVVDVYTPSLTIHPANSAPGNVHYTEKGYELLAEPIIQAIKSIL